MPELSTLFAFAGAALVLLAIPGPAVIYIITRGASQGRTAAFVSVLGVHTGTSVHVAAAVAGLSAVIVSSAAAFTAVKLAGAAYLLVIGVRTLLSRPSDACAGPAALRHRPLRRVFADGVVLNVLNPKTAVFFLAFVPQFVSTSAGSGPATAQILVLGVTFVALGLVTDGAYAIASGWIGERLGRSAKAERRKNVVAGGTYVGLGLVTALSGSGHTTG